MNCSPSLLRRLPGSSSGAFVPDAADLPEIRSEGGTSLESANRSVVAHAGLSSTPAGSRRSRCTYQLCDTNPFGLARQYTYDAANRPRLIATLNQPAFECYGYAADDSRVIKQDNKGHSTQYLQFSGQPIAEKDQTGAWTDYVYANGKRIAMVQASKPAMHLHGVQTPGAYGTCGTPWYVGGQNSSINGYIVQQGDVLSFDHKALHALSGLWLGFGPGTYGGGSYSADMTDTAPDGNWHHSSTDLSSFANQTVTALVVGPGNPYTPVGPYDVWMANITIQSGDGTVHPIFTGGAASGSIWGTCGNTNLSLTVDPTATDAVTAATFYVGDHLGSAQMEFSASGTPLSLSQFMPFGGEINPPVTANHYKFTGKERDTESGLDYFGARYYGSNMGRFMSPDWSARAEPIPYAKLDDPQSLNLYSYVGNNPLSRFDLDGHCWKGFGWACDAAQSISNGFHGLGFQTNASVDREQHNANQLLHHDGVQTEGLSRRQVRKAYHLDMALGSIRAQGDDGFIYAIRNRPTAAQARAIWEKATGGKVPYDDSMGRFYDMAHKTAIGDSGDPRDPANLEPMLHSDHVDSHRENGDFARWGARSGAPGEPADVTVEPGVPAEPMIPFEPIIPPGQ